MSFLGVVTNNAVIEEEFAIAKSQFVLGNCPTWAVVSFLRPTQRTQALKIYY